MELIILLSLCWMGYEDFRTRSVWLWQLLLFGVLQLGVSIYRYGWVPTGWNVLTNVAILLIIGAAVGVYSFIRFRGKEKPIGMGDVVFILLLTPYFPSIPFLYFLIFSCSLTLIAWVAWCLVSKKEDRHIPLISGVGACYALLLIVHVIDPLWL